MAKPKCSVLVKRLDELLIVHCDHHAEQAAEVKAIEGVSSVTICEANLMVLIDPRYDRDAVADEIEVMLAPIEIPEAFLDGSFDAIDSAGQD